jgi:hypothetical protein
MNKIKIPLLFFAIWLLGQCAVVSSCFGSACGTLFLKKNGSNGSRGADSETPDSRRVLPQGTVPISVRPVDGLDLLKNGLPTTLVCLRENLSHALVSAQAVPCDSGALDLLKNGLPTTLGCLLEDLSPALASAQAVPCDSGVLDLLKNGLPTTLGCLLEDLSHALASTQAVPCDSGADAPSIVELPRFFPPESSRLDLLAHTVAEACSDYGSLPIVCELLPETRSRASYRVFTDYLMC